MSVLQKFRFLFIRWENFHDNFCIIEDFLGKACMLGSDTEV